MRRGRRRPRDRKAVRLPNVGRSQGVFVMPKSTRSFIGLVVLAWLGAHVPAHAFDVRDRAGLFSPEAVREANQKLKAIEERTGVPVRIEVVPSLAEVLTPQEEAQKAEKKPLDMINEVALRIDKQEGNRGIYVLIAKKEGVNSNVLIPKGLEAQLPAARRAAIRDELTRPFKERQFDKGLGAAVATIDEFLPGKSGPQRDAAPKANPGPNGGQRGSFMGTLLFFGFIILAIWLVLRVVGAIFRGIFGGGQYRAQGPMRPGYGPGYGPAPGGGGFMSSLFGGIGGALFGNYLYDQFSGRHHHGGGEAQGWTGPTTPSDGGGIVGGDDPNRNASWGGGDWGGGDTGGGGDWGGGGGDWGGGGGGDWGGGGGDGGGW